MYVIRGIFRCKSDTPCATDRVSVFHRERMRGGRPGGGGGVCNEYTRLGTKLTNDRRHCRRHHRHLCHHHHRRHHLHRCTTTRGTAAFRGFYGAHCNYTMGIEQAAARAEAEAAQRPGHRCRTATITSSSTPLLPTQQPTPPPLPPIRHAPIRRTTCVTDPA